MVYLKTFKISNDKIKNHNIYPYNVFKDKEPDILIFDNITVLYGNNGSGKSTLLNIIANRLNLKGKERDNPKVIGNLDYFEDFVSKCEYELSENENGKKIFKIPENSRYIKSEEILYEIRKIQQDNVLEAYDMTTEAVVTKLMWILSLTKDPKVIKEMFYTTISNDILFKKNID